MNRLTFDSLPVCAAADTEDKHWFFEGFVEQGQLVVVDAPCGVGMTWFLMNMISAATSGASCFEKFRSAGSCKAIYLNSGMELSEVQGRFNKVVASEHFPKVKIVCANEIYKQQNKIFFDLSNREYRDIIHDGFEKDQEYKLLVIDSFDSFFPQYRSKSNIINNWFLELKQLGVTVVVANNSKAKIGGDLVDLELILEEVARGDQFALKVSYSKARNLPKDQCKPFLVSMGEGGDGLLRMAYEEYSQGITERVAYLISEGVTQTEVGKMLGINQSTVSRRVEKARNAGLLEKKGQYLMLTSDGKNRIKGKVEDLLPD